MTDVPVSPVVVNNPENDPVEATTPCTTVKESTLAKPLVASVSTLTDVPVIDAVVSSPENEPVEATKPYHRLPIERKAEA